MPRIPDTTMDIVDLARTLIDIPSLTGNEAAVSIWLEEFCQRQGWSVNRQEVAEGRWNVFVNWENFTDVAFCTHTDTVPQHFPSRIEETRLYGRGACDTKGIMASMLSAGVELSSQGVVPSYLFTPGEERDSIGAKAAARSGRSSRFIVVGEPTENALALAHKGVLSYTVQCTGVAGHSAYPDRGRSAIHDLLDLIAIIREHNWGDDPVLGPSTLNVGRIQGGIAPNVFADSASATIVHRLVDSLDRRKNEVLEICGDKAELVFHSENNPQWLHVPEGFPVTTVAFGTDIPYLRPIATPLLLGPGSIHQAHTDDEFIDIGEMREAVSLYTRLYLALRNEQS